MFRHPRLGYLQPPGGSQPEAAKGRETKRQHQKTDKVDSPDRKAERLVPIQTSNPPKNELGQRHREPPNPPRNLPTLQTPNQPISTAPTEGQRRAANSDMGAGGLLGRKKGLRAPAGRRGRSPEAASTAAAGQKAGPGGATGPISATAPSVKGPFSPSDRPFWPSLALFGPSIRLQARPLRLHSAFLCPSLHSRSSLPRPRPPQKRVRLSPRVFRLRGWEMMIWYFAFSVLPLSLGLG